MKGSIDLRETSVGFMEHSIRTPLAVVSGMLKTVNHRDLAPAERDRLCNIAERRCDELCALVDTMFQSMRTVTT